MWVLRLLVHCSIFLILGSVKGSMACQSDKFILNDKHRHCSSRVIEECWVIELIRHVAQRQFFCRVHESPSPCWRHCKIGLLIPRSFDSFLDVHERTKSNTWELMTDHLMPDPDGATYYNHSSDDLRLWGAASPIITEKFCWLIDLIMIKNGLIKRLMTYGTFHFYIYWYSLKNSW